MTTTSRTRLVRAGLLVLPAGGVLKLLGNIGTFDSVGYGIPQPAEAATVTSTSFLVGELVGSILPTLLVPFGVLALFAVLLPYGYRRTLTAALVCAVLGAGAILPGLGVVNFAMPALGRAYRDGWPGAMTIVDSFLTWPRGAMLYPAALFPIGVILFAVVMWQARPVPRPATVVFALSAVLIAVPLPWHSVRLVGGALQLVAGAWIWRRMPTLCE
ncbi:hypothetical protein [Kutzneria buriramensis]|uniref:Uncharacterized protein n=1 Tax=Kutzneria buriramensis TaxID=1045776 RepID=A0A3E0GTZ3_9PSEU|nr:hypothetical protein [Kutzneria buriramensis]REH27671.1 hypothetical protein BCF44_12959 [Kutzneria buriramensis]